MNDRFAPGDVVLLRHVHEGRAYFAVPARIVADDDVVAWWIAPGTPGIYPLGLADERLLLPLREWATREHAWYGSGNLDVTRPGDWYGLRLFWSGDGAFEAWYVNLQEPLRRTPRGFDTRDLQLDLLVRPDGSCELKDEDHLAQAVAFGHVDAELARGLREEVERLRANPPWPTGWEGWRPDPAWPVPELPPDWDRVE